MELRYEVDAELNLRIYNDLDEHGLPFCLQPHWPDGTPWKDKKQASAWAEAMIASMLDDEAPLAGPSPDMPTMPRPVDVAPVAPEEIPAE